MITVVLFDLGMTILDQNNRPFPHAIEGLVAVAGLPLKSCLVSDFDMKLSIAQAMIDYLEILEVAGVKTFFEPTEQRVTLSNHAGFVKPHAGIFKKALERLGVPQTPFSECLFVTENSAHIQSVKSNLRMSTLQFGLDFINWSDFPTKVAEMQQDQSNWISISVPGHADLANILVQVPGTSPDEIAEVRSFVASLAGNRRIAGRPESPAFQPTHALEQDAQGHRRLVRKRFTAVKH